MKCTLRIRPKDVAILEIGDTRFTGQCDMDLDEKHASFNFRSPLKRNGDKEYLARIMAASATVLKRGESSVEVSNGTFRFDIEEAYKWEDENRKVIRDAIREKRNANFKARYVDTRMRELKRKYEGKIENVQIKYAVCIDGENFSGDDGVGISIHLTDDLLVKVRHSLKYKKYIVESRIDYDDKCLATTTQFDKLLRILDKLTTKSFLNLPLKTPRKSKEEKWVDA